MDLTRRGPGGARAPRRRARGARGRGLRRGQPLAAHPAQLHLAHPLQRRGGAEVHRDDAGSASRRSSTGPTAGRWSASARSRAISRRTAPGARSPRRARPRSTIPSSARCRGPPASARALVGYHDPRLMDVADAELVEAGWKVIAGGLRAFMASSRLADLVPDEAGLKRLGLILGGDVTHPPGAHRDRLHARCPSPRPTTATLHVGLRHRAWWRRATPRAPGGRITHAARALHRRGGRRGGGQRGGRDRRRAGAVGRLHGGLRPPAGGRPLQQPDRPVLPGGLLLLLEHAVPGPARPRRSPRAGSASTTTAPCRASRAPRASPARACPPAAPT